MMKFNMKKTVNKPLAMLLLGLLFSVNLLAQGTLKGVVSDAQGATIPGASISIAGTTQGTTSGADGSYNLKLNNGTYDVRF